MSDQKKTYRVKTPLRFNGDVYHPDDEEKNTVEMTDKEAKTLLAMEAISEVTGEKVAAPEGGNGTAGATEGAGTTDGAGATDAPTDPADRMAAIKDAISKLEPGNKEHWLKDGKTPEVKALEELLGWDIKAEERNQAMQELQAEAAKE